MKKLFAHILALAMLLTPAFAAGEPASETPAETPEPPVFSDISGHYAEDLIVKYHELGVINGYPDGTFRPDNWVTRAETAAILSRALDQAGKEVGPLDTEAAYGRGWYKTHDGIASEDIDLSAWYFPYVEKMESYLPTYHPAYSSDTDVLRPYIKNYRNLFQPDAYMARFILAETMVELKFALEGLEDSISGVWTSTHYLEEAYREGILLEVISAVGEFGDHNNMTRTRNYVWLAYKYDIMRGDGNGYFRPYDGVTRAEMLVVIDKVLGDSGN